MHWPNSIYAAQTERAETGLPWLVINTRALERDSATVGCARLLEQPLQSTLRPSNVLFDADRERLSWNKVKTLIDVALQARLYSTSRFGYGGEWETSAGHR